MDLGSSSAIVLIGRFEKLKKIKTKPLEIAKGHFISINTLWLFKAQTTGTFQISPGNLESSWNQDGQEKYQ